MKPSLLSPPKSRESLYFKLAVCALLILPVIVFWPGLFGGKMLWGSDIETLELPFSISARRSLAHGEIPFWMPELLGGMPAIAAANLVFLYPSEILIDLLKVPASQGFALDAAFQVFVAGFGMLLFCRRLGASLEASFLAALAFALSGSEVSILLAGHINNIKAIALIPWCFWAAHKAMQERSFLGWGLCGLALALQILGVGMQIFAYTIIGLALFTAWMAWAQRPSESFHGLKAKPWLFGGIGLAFALGLMGLIAAPQLWLSFQYKPYSWRADMGYEQFTSWSFNPKSSITWWIPGFYGWHEPTYRGDWPFCLNSEYFGILPWVLAIVAAGSLFKERRGIVRFLLGFALLSFLIGLGKWTPLNLLFYHLPIYSGFRTWSRFLTLFSFSICALASLGYDVLQKEGSKAAASRLALGASLAVALLACLCLVAASGIAQDDAAAMASKLGSADAAKSQILELIQSSAFRSLALAFAFAILFWFRPLKSWTLIFFLLLGLQAWDISDLCSRFLVFKDPGDVLLQPPAFGELPDPELSPEPYRILEVAGGGQVWPMNHGIILGYENLLGYHGLELSAPKLLNQAMASRQQDLIDLMGVRYLLSRSPLGGLPLLHDGDIKIYQNPRALPRAFLVTHALQAADDASEYALLADPHFDPAQDVVLSADSALATRQFEPGSVTWLGRTPNHFELSVLAKSQSALVISQTWYPSWRCELDGKDAPILKADGALDAVLLGPGSHELHFYYDSGLFRLSLLASGFGILLLLGLGYAQKRYPGLA